MDTIDLNLISLIGRLHPEAYDALFPRATREALELNPQPLPPHVLLRSPRGSAQVAVIHAVRNIADTIVTAEVVSGPGTARGMFASWEDGDLCPRWWPGHWPKPKHGPWVIGDDEVGELVAVTLATISGEVGDDDLAAGFRAQAGQVARAAGVG